MGDPSPVLSSLRAIPPPPAGTYGFPTVEKSVIRTELASETGKGEFMRGLSPRRKMRMAA